MDRELFSQKISHLPLYQYEFIETAELRFEPRVRHICSAECPMYGKTWACPPAVGTPEVCLEKCSAYENALLISTVTEVNDIANMDETLATRGEHEGITREVIEVVQAMGHATYGLSSEACSICDSCTYPDAPCRHPERMLPCIESHCILVTEIAEKYGIEFINGANVVTWFSLIFYR